MFNFFSFLNVYFLRLILVCGDEVAFGLCAPGPNGVVDINNAILGVGKVTLKLVFVPGVVAIG